MQRSGKAVKLYDEVPAMLYHIYQKESLGRYFIGENGEIDYKKIEAWVRREYLYMGFKDKDMRFMYGNTESPEIIPLIEALSPA